MRVTTPLTFALLLALSGCAAAPPDGSDPGVDLSPSGKADGGRDALIDFLLEGFTAEEIFIFSSRGFEPYLPPAAYTTTWSAESIEGWLPLMPEAETLTIRNSLDLQLSHAGSERAAAAYARLTEAIGDQEISRAALRDAADAALPRQEQQEGVRVVWMKAGSFDPRLFPARVPVADESGFDMGHIYALFHPGNVFTAADAVGPEEHAAILGAEAAAFAADYARATGDDDPHRFSARELEAYAAGVLSVDEILEARAMRLAVMAYEQTQSILRTDVGGWGGNLRTWSFLNGGDERFVCTDESTTMTLFSRLLADEGLINHFVVGRRLGHRFTYRTGLRRRLLGEARPLSDHFSVFLRNARGYHFALDSWIEDGGNPANFHTWADHQLHVDDNDIVSLPADPAGFITGLAPMTVEEVREAGSVEARPVQPPAGYDAAGLQRELSTSLTTEELFHFTRHGIVRQIPSFYVEDVWTANELRRIARDWLRDRREPLRETFDVSTVMQQAWSDDAADALDALAAALEEPRFAPLLVVNTENPAMVEDNQALGVPSQLLIELATAAFADVTARYSDSSVFYRLEADGELRTVALTDAERESIANSEWLPYDEVYAILAARAGSERNFTDADAMSALGTGTLEAAVTAQMAMSALELEGPAASRAYRLVRTPFGDPRDPTVHLGFLIEEPRSFEGATVAFPVAAEGDQPGGAIYLDVDELVRLYGTGERGLSVVPPRR